MTDVRAIAPVWAISDEGFAALAAPTGQQQPVLPTAIVGNVARIHVRGPLVSSAGFLDMLLGACSYGAIVADVAAAMADPDVSAVVAYFDTPGGLVTGAHEASQAIRQMRGTKPLVAYVSGACCSAGYWLASAFDRIVASPAAQVGCLGVLAVAVDATGALAAAGVKRVTVRSSQTPAKAPEGLGEAHIADLQAKADALAAVFLADVARNRGVPEADVAARYGAGATLVGADALAAGLVDGIAGPDDTWLYAGGMPPLALMNPGGVRASQEVPMPLDANTSQAGASDASATAGTPPDPGVAKVVLTATEHEEYLRLRAERTQYEQAKREAAEARTLAAANGEALKAAQAEAAAAKAQADATAVHVAAIRRTTALASANAVLKGHAESGRIDAATRKLYEADFADAALTAEQIDTISAGHDRLISRLPVGAARPKGTSGTTPQAAGDDIDSPVALVAYVHAVAARDFRGDFAAALEHVQKTEPAKYAAAYGLNGGGVQ